ncbi:unnamed protein product [Mytilus coruscus]|uniref:CCHC-type domain-containing protein n=1 Tax=Mytilus coruscus TaxID=42192 RepID=A0A6J8C913_MYTCO|nr:unnamed protein product [Mytilus coruscus]
MDSTLAVQRTVWNSQVDHKSTRSMPSCIDENEYPTQEMDRCRISNDILSCCEESQLHSQTLQPEEHVEYELSDKPDPPSQDQAFRCQENNQSVGIQHDNSESMIEVQLNQQPRFVGGNCKAYELSTVMIERDFENPNLNDRFQQSQASTEQDFYSQNRQTGNQHSRSLDNSIDYIQPPQQTVQLPVEHTINFNQQRQQAVQLPVEHNVNYSRSHTQAIQLPGDHTVTNTQPTQQTIQQSTRHTISNIQHQPQGTSMSSRQMPTQPTFNRSTPTTVNQPVNHRATGQQPPQPTINRSNPTTVNQSVNHRATGQQPPQPTINRSNPITAYKSTPPVRERKPCQQPQPTVNRAHQPPCPRSTRQSTSQQNYNIPSNTAGRQNFIRVIDYQQHQPPISQPVPIPPISSQVLPTQHFFNRPGQHQPNINQSGFQQPFINTIGQQGQPPQAILHQQEFYRQQPVQHLHKVTAPLHQPQQPFGNIPYQQGRPDQPSTTHNLAQGTAQSCYYGQLHTCQCTLNNNNNRCTTTNQRLSFRTKEVYLGLRAAQIVIQIHLVLHPGKAVQAHIAQEKTPDVKQALAPTPTAQVSDTPSVYGVGSSKSAIDTRVSQMEKQLRQQREEQQQSMQQMQSLLSSMATLTEEMRQSNRSNGTSPSRDYRADHTSRGRGQGRRGGYNNRSGNRRTQIPDGACFYCHKQGHYKRDCPELNNSPGRQPPNMIF